MKTMPKMIPPVNKSSQIVCAGHAKMSKNMIIEFKGGAQYLYEQVPHQTFDALINAPSAGSFFHSEVKGKFRYTKIKNGAPKPPKEIPANE